MDAPAAGPPFTITRQEHEPSYDPSQPNLSKWTVYFRTPSGVDSFVQLAGTEYTAERVASLIMPLAAEIERVHALNQGPVA